MITIEHTPIKTQQVGPNYYMSEAHYRVLPDGHWTHVAACGSSEDLAEQAIEARISCKSQFKTTPNAARDN